MKRWLQERRPPIPAHPARRRLLGAGAAAALAALAPFATAQPPRMEPPREDPRWRIPGEFEPQRTVWLGFDRSMVDTTAALVSTLAPYTSLSFLVPDDAGADGVRQLLTGLDLGDDGVDIMVEPTAMYYPRDGTVFVTGPDGALGVVDFRWSQYGLPAWCRRRHPGDGARALACAAEVDGSRDDLDRAMARLTGARVLPSSLFIEGGGIESNGQGLLIANESLVRSRNPGLSRAQLERLHLQLPGVRRVIWLPEGLAHDPHLRGTITGNYVAWGTGGHTDEFVRFTAPDTVMLAWPDDDDALAHPVARLNRHRMRRNAAILEATRTVDGRPLRVIRVPLPRTIEREVVLSAEADRSWFDQWSADYFPAAERRREGDTVIQVAVTSYLNFVVANGVVVVPDYVPHGTPPERQARVQAQFEQAFPGRAITFVDAAALNWLGGGMHCATLHEPLPA